MNSEWKIYRTRFLVRAKQITAPMMFVDLLGREHRGQEGDYLVETSDGLQRIASRQIFEDIYVAMGPAEIEKSLPHQRNFTMESQNSPAPARSIAS